MNSRYGSLRVLGTLCLILAWVVLVLGIAGSLGAWFGLGDFLDSISTGFRWVALFAAIPALLWGIGGFLWFFGIGKVLHLLVDLDERSLAMKRSADEQLELAQETRRLMGSVIPPTPSIAVTAPEQPSSRPTEAAPAAQ